MKFFIFSDPHYSDMETAVFTRRPSASLGKLKALASVLAGCDGIICLGDLIDKCDADRKTAAASAAAVVNSDADLTGANNANAGNSENAAYSADSAAAAYLREITDFLISFGKPVYSLMGNHDCAVFSREDFAKISGLDVTPRAVKNGKSTMIFLDACYLAGDFPQPVGKSDWTDSNLPAEQINLLSETLDSLPAGESVFVFTHQCLDPAAESRHIIKNAPDVRELLETAVARGLKVHAIAGHYHKGSENTVAGVRYTTLPALCELDSARYLLLEI